MDTKTFFTVSHKKGQSTVEYILLLGVIMTLTISILNSEPFQNFLGPDSTFLTVLKNRMEYSYRHGLGGQTDETNYDSASHDNYSGDGQSRFFIPTDDPYP